MLDFGDLVTQIETMLTAQRDWLSQDTLDQIARELCDRCDRDENFNAAVVSALDRGDLPEGWHPAQLLDPRDALRTSLPAPELVGPIRICSADGSQIFPDAHEIAFCYVLHLSRIALLYDGGDSHAEMSAGAHFYHEGSEDEWHEEAAKHGGVPQREFVEARRHVAELDALADCLEAAGETAVGLSDGILQLHPSAAHAWRDFALAQNARALNRLRQSGHPVAAYIAASRAIDVVTALRVVLRTRQDAGELDADGFARSDAALARFNDVRLFDALLQPGDRSAIFLANRFRPRGGGEEKTKSGSDGAAAAACFFYLKLDEGEVARLEFPRWVADSVPWVNLLHAAALDQAARGEGYPVALMEAHEHAVIRGPERDAFFRLLEELMTARGITPQRSAKKRAKMRPLV